MFGKCNVCGLERECVFTPLSDSVYSKALRRVINAPDAQGLLTCAHCDSKEHPIENDPAERAERMDWLFSEIKNDLKDLEERLNIKALSVDRHGESALVVLDNGEERRAIEATLPELARMRMRLIWTKASKILATKI